jgi:TetR/AcrR family transcriptional regulator, regulator of autoinduction and epiphytic fitness
MQENDGRLARSARTRVAIVDALRALNQEGDLRPTAPRIAERAGVSLRTIWQHFEDFEALLLEAGQRDFELVVRHVTPIDERLPLEDRIRLLVAQRAATFADLAPVWRAARLHEPFSAELRRSRDRLVRASRMHLQRLFAAELDALPTPVRRVTLDALQVATNFPAWDAMHSELGLSDAQASSTMRLLVERLLLPGPGPGAHLR